MYQWWTKKSKTEKLKWVLLRFAMKLWDLEPRESQQWPWRKVWASKPGRQGWPRSYNKVMRQAGLASP